MEDIDTLYLSGGALKGFCYIGMLKFLEEKDIVKNIKAFYGVSVGSFTSMLFVLGYSYKEIKTIMLKFDFTTLIEPCFENFIEKFGVNKGEKLDNFIKIFISNKNYPKDITLKEFYKKTGKYICCVTTNLSKRIDTYISHENFPDLELWKAVRMSCNIPVIFEPVIYKGEKYVDGFLTGNTPVPVNEGRNNLCIILDTPPSEYNLNNLSEYTYTLLKTALSKIHNITLQKIKDSNNIVLVFTVNKTDSINFKISIEEKNKLIKIGYEQTKTFFEKEFS